MSYIGTKKIKSVYIGTQKVKSVYVGTNKVYSSETIEPYLTFTALQANSKVKFYQSGTYSGSLQYSIDKVNWYSWYYGGSYSTVKTLSNIGDKLYVRNLNSTLTSGQFRFYSDGGSFDLSGNIMSLLNYGELYDSCFMNMFSGFPVYDITKLSLPATTLTTNCYAFMFRDTQITEMCELPAKTLAVSCYNSMFDGCSKLVTLKPLPATTLADSCYLSMFGSCETLVTAMNELPATTLADSCYSSMFKGCSKLKYPPIINAKTFGSYSCKSMFYSCSYLAVSSSPVTGYVSFFKTPSSISNNEVTDMFKSTYNYGVTMTTNTTYYYRNVW